MSERDQNLYLYDIMGSISRIEEYTKDMDFKKFSANNMAKDAVIRNFAIIGEAAANISDELQNQYPSIPWKKMKGIRNIVIHEYFGVDLNIVWKTVRKSLPELKKAIIKIIEQEKTKE